MSTSDPHRPRSDRDDSSAAEFGASGVGTPQPEDRDALPGADSDPPDEPQRPSPDFIEETPLRAPERGER